MKRFKIITLITLMTLSSSAILHAAVSASKCGRSDIKVKPINEGSVKVNYLMCVCQGKNIYLQVTGMIREKDYTNLMKTCPNGNEELADKHFITPEYSVFVDSNGGDLNLQDHLAFQEANKTGLNNQLGQLKSNPDVELTKFQQGRMGYYENRSKAKSEEADALGKEFITANEEALKAGKAAPYEYNKETDRWTVSDQIRAKGTNGENIGGWKQSDLNKFERQANKYNNARQKSEALAANADQVKTKAMENDLEEKTKSYEEAISRANGDYNEAYTERRNDLIYKFEQACVKHQSIKKEKSGDMKATLLSFGYPETDKDLQAASKKVNTDLGKEVIADGELALYKAREGEEEKEFTGSGCEPWATFHATNGDELVAAREHVVNKDDEVQMSYDANGTPSEENKDLQKEVEEQLADAFDYESCVNSQGALSISMINDSISYATTGEGAPREMIDYSAAYRDSILRKQGAYDDKDLRKIRNPASCINDQKKFITNQDYSYYTDFTDSTAALLTEDGKARVCEGALFLRGEDNVACNDLFKAAQSCSKDDRSPFINESSKAEFKFDSITNAQIVHTFLNPPVQDDEQVQEEGSIDSSKNTEKSGSGLTFREQDHCEKFMMNKFKQCVGTTYTKIDMAVPIDPVTKLPEVDPTTKEPVAPVAKETKVDRAHEESYAASKTKLAREMNIQFGTCIAFRKLSQDLMNDLGEPWAQPGQTHASADGRVTCHRSAPWTMDFKACKNLADTQSGFMVGDMARNVGGQGWSMVRQNQIRNESQDQMTGANQNGTLQPGDKGYVSPQDNQVNVALDTQKKMYEHQKNKETMNLGFHSAQAGTLTTLLSTYPTPNKIGRQSEGHPYLETIIEASNADTSIKAELFANQESRKRMWAQVMESAASATLAALKASQYKKMANDVQTYKNAFNDLNKDATSSSSTLEVGYCSLNPTAPGCTNTGPRVMGNSQFSYGSIGAQNGSGGAIDFNSDQGNLGAFDEAELTQSQQTAIDDLGSVIDQDSAGSFGNDFKKVGAGKFSRSPASGGGGGGGGGGAGGGGSAYNGGGAGGGAGGNNPAFGGAKQKVSYGAAGGKVKYSGSGSGSSKKSSNPFSSLFGKKKGRNVASKVTNDIAPSHSGLFDKISKRYTKMQQADRLHKLK